MFTPSVRNQRNSDARLSKRECVVNYHEMSILGYHMDFEDASGYVEYPGVDFGYQLPTETTPTVFLED